MQARAAGTKRTKARQAPKSRGGAPCGNQNAVGNRGGPGAPTKYRPDDHPRLALNLALLGLTDASIAGVLDVSEVTLNAWKAAHPEFLAALRDGKEPADAKVAGALYERALTGDPQAARYWLNNRRRASGQWGERHELTGADGGAIRVETKAQIPWELLSPDLREAVREELEAERDRLEAEAGVDGFQSKDHPSQKDHRHAP